MTTHKMFDIQWGGCSPAEVRNVPHARIHPLKKGILLQLPSVHSSLSQGQHLHSVTTDGSPQRLAIVDVTATQSWQVAATLDGEEIAILEVAQHYVTVKVSKVHAKRYNLCQHTPFTFKHTYTNIYYFSFTINRYHIYNYITLHTTPHHPPLYSLKPYNQGTIACCSF